VFRVVAVLNHEPTVPLTNRVNAEVAEKSVPVIAVVPGALNAVGAMLALGRTVNVAIAVAAPAATEIVCAPAGVAALTGYVSV